MDIFKKVGFYQINIDFKNQIFHSNISAKPQMLTKVPKFIRNFFPKRLWKVTTEEKVLYLTFDDGPIPEVTPWVLEQLKKYSARATFFCIGDNIRKHPEIFQQLISEGHSIGNHTFNHLNGWHTPPKEYLENTVLTEETILQAREGKTVERKHRKQKREEGKTKEMDNPTDISVKDGSSSSSELLLFRPPYGRITGKQAKLLEERNYKIVMWDILSRDYNSKLASDKCLRNVLKYTSPGSIIVFHDSLKAEKNLKAVLPRVLEYYSSKGFTFEKLKA